jgi:adenosyl cobinamide kinase/adenosyl cobinamide phosphate guanylyltransferase
MKEDNTRPVERQMISVIDRPLRRFYRDALGRANQRVAAAVDRVLFTVVGLAMRIK